MSIYPKQLQYYDWDSQASSSVGKAPNVRKGRGTHPVYPDGFVPPSNVTVNELVSFVIPSTIYGVDLTGASGFIRTRPEHRQFDGSFGDTVVFPASVAITGGKVVNEIIDILRLLYDQNRARTSTRTGYATSVLN